MGGVTKNVNSQILNYLCVIAYSNFDFLLPFCEILDSDIAPLFINQVMAAIYQDFTFITAITHFLSIMITNVFIIFIENRFNAKFFFKFSSKIKAIV
jgi:hypothetical protein